MTRVSHSNKTPNTEKTKYPVRKRRKITRRKITNTEKVDSINTNNETFFCEICTDTKRKKESFTIISCNHSLCIDCMIRYVSSKVRRLQVHRVKINCPFCMDSYFNVEDCHKILPKEVLNLWEKLLCEAAIPEADKFYCPFKDCSALMIDDGGRKLTRKFKCFHCDRMFCAQCKVAWHHGIRCKQFQILNKDEIEKEDVKLMKMAKKKSWQRCPNCKFYVDKIDGCRTMNCRCGESFCYVCGLSYKNKPTCSCGNFRSGIE